MWQRKLEVSKRKLVTSISEMVLFKKGCDLRCSKVAKEDFGPEGGLILCLLCL
jgi:hypothetical protein